MAVAVGCGRRQSANGKRCGTEFDKSSSFLSGQPSARASRKEGLLLRARGCDFALLTGTIGKDGLEIGGLLGLRGDRERVWGSAFLPGVIRARRASRAT